jgi:para-nitrobenzyl esterase
MKSIWLRLLLLAPLLAAFACSARTETSPRDATAELGGTSWQLVKFQSSDGKTLTPDDKAKYTIAFDTDGRVSARIDCNRGSGTWKSSGPNHFFVGAIWLQTKLL